MAQFYNGLLTSELLEKIYWNHVYISYGFILYCINNEKHP
jgi:hypothetical protein